MLRRVAFGIVLAFLLLLAMLFTALNQQRFDVDIAFAKFEVSSGLALLIAFAAGLLAGAFARSRWVAELLAERGRLRQALRLAERRLGTVSSVSAPSSPSSPSSPSGPSGPSSPSPPSSTSPLPMPTDVQQTFWWTLAGTLAIGWGVTTWRTLVRRKRRHVRRARYLEGVRFLLDDKPDRALEVFLSLSEIDDETVDTHFALGSLYRRRGEVDRAIRVHQHIVDRTSLSEGTREAALTELARDYFRAGLFDRAEELFLSLAGSGREPALALSHLVRIYEIQHEWQQAADAHKRLRNVGVPEQPAAIAHFYCEMAETAIAAQDYKRAIEHLDSAAREQNDFGRGAILRGDLARRQGDPRLAVQLYRGVVRRDFHLLALVLPRLADAAKQAGEPQQFDETLQELVRRGAGNPAEIAYAAIVSGYYDDPVILDCVRDMLTIDSDLRDMTAAFLPAGAEPTREQLHAIAGALRNVVLRHARYRCSQCGLDSSTFLWHCPGCHAWDTLRGVAALEFLPKAALPRSAA